MLESTVNIDNRNWSGIGQRLAAQKGDSQDGEDLAASINAQEQAAMKDDGSDNDSDEE